MGFAKPEGHGCCTTMGTEKSGARELWISDGEMETRIGTIQFYQELDEKELDPHGVSGRGLRNLILDVSPVLPTPGSRVVICSTSSA